jgi:predicted transport protein
MPTLDGMTSPDDMMAAVTASMAERTGRDLDGWARLVLDESGVDPLDQVAVRRWLRDVHGVPQNTQWAIAFEVARRAGWVEPTVDEYVDSQYTGRKAALRPVYDAVEAALLGLGDDVRREGRSTYVPFVRARQFAAVGATATRVDVGLRFVSPPASARLVAATAPGSATHKVVLTNVGQVDDELVGLLRAAYEQNG